MLDITTLDDSSGEALGEGLDSSALDLSGSSADLSFDDLLQGSSVELGGDFNSASIFDGSQNSLDDQYNLAGVSEAAPSESFDSLEWDTNGAGSATTVHPSTSTSPENVSTWFSGIAKFGASIGQMFASGGASARPVVAGAPLNTNPNRTGVTGITTSHAFLLIAVVVGIGAVVALGGKN